MQNEEIVNRICWVAIGRHGWMILTYMYREQLWDKQYQITNKYLDRFSRNKNLYFVALGVGVSVYVYHFK